MSRFARGIRLIPIVLVATTCLFALKTAGLLAGEGYVLGGLQRALAQVPDIAVRPQTESSIRLEAKRSWAQEMFGFPEITGSINAKKNSAPAPDTAKQLPEHGSQAPAKPKTNVEAPFVLEGDRSGLSAGERAVLERLQERRQELEARARELEIRDGLLKAAEKRIETRIGELKELEAQINAATQKKEEAEVARFKSLVTMYENMKAKEAARIFDRLELRILIDVASQINARRMSDILAQMSPEAAERLTVELATRSQANGKPASTADLPKIEGRPRI
jgi:flagellar motility protein MotE (MotC chaperone)